VAYKKHSSPKVKNVEQLQIVIDGIRFVILPANPKYQPRNESNSANTALAGSQRPSFQSTCSCSFRPPSCERRSLSPSLNIYF
jgi:hypothetical protein